MPLPEPPSLEVSIRPLRCWLALLLVLLARTRLSKLHALIAKSTSMLHDSRHQSLTGSAAASWCRMP